MIDRDAEAQREWRKAFARVSVALLASLMLAAGVQAEQWRRNSEQAQAVAELRSDRELLLRQAGVNASEATCRSRVVNAVADVESKANTVFRQALADAFVDNQDVDLGARYAEATALNKRVVKLSAIRARVSHLCADNPNYVIPAD